MSMSGTAALALVAGLALVASPASAASPDLDRTPDTAAVSPQVHNELAADGTTDFWVYLGETADLSGADSAADRGAQGRYVYERLTETAERTQAGLLRMLEAEGVAYESYWIANTVKVRGDAELLERIATRPEVSRITADKVYELPEPIQLADGPRTMATEWGLDDVNAPQVWDEFTRGDGIVVGAIDSGALYTHEAIVGQYRGNLGNGQFDHNYNWWDPSEVCGSPSLEPCDNSGHGTHVIGTMTGDDGGTNQVGVAPEAQWIVAKGCETSNCSTSALLSSGQFIAAPTDLDGNNPNPALRPHIVNNSWGGGANTDPWYQQTVQNWVDAGIFPVFAAGNTPPPATAPCGSASNPGNLVESYAVGAYDVTHTLADFSNRGFSAWGDNLVKPNISAPGVNVRSAWNDGGYNSISGTSMAAPHVAGSVALMWAAAPTLVRDVGATRDLLDQTAVDTDDLTCGGTPENNNMYGEGRLDVLAAVDAAPVGGSGTLTGTVTDASSGDPISGATVTITGEVEREVVTGVDGGYAQNLPAGDFTATVTAFGYTTASADVTVVTDETTTQDFALQPSANSTVTGTVTDGSGHGWPLYAEVTVDGTPVSTFTDPYTGEFSLDLPQGASFTLSVAPVYPGYETASATVDTATDVDVDVPVTVAACALAPGYEFGAAVGILGDQDGLIGAHLAEQGIPTTALAWGDDMSGFDAIVVNRPGDPGQEDFLQFLADTDAAGTGLVLLDTWSVSGNGIVLMQTHTGNPPVRDRGFSGSIPYLYYEVVAEHPVLDGFSVGDEIIFDDSSGDKDHAWFDGYTGDGTTVLANAARADEGVQGQGIAVQQRDNNRHVLLSMHAASTFTDPTNWHEDGAQVFRNALAWVAGGAEFACNVVDGGLVAGQVQDLNTGDGVDDATVTSVDNPEETTTSFATPDDPGLGDGFYWMFSSLTGSHEFTAAADGYTADAQQADVAPDATTPVDFGLGAGQLTVTPTELDATVRLGQSAEREFTITNTGTAPAALEVIEAGGSFQILGGDGTVLRHPDGATVPASTPAGAAAALTRAGSAGDGAALATSGLAPGRSATPAMAPAAAGEVTITHSLSQEVVSLNSIACFNSGLGVTRDNRFLRAFTLADFDISSNFDVSSVSFGVETLNVEQVVSINLYTLAGDELTYANLDQIGTTDVTLAPQELSMVSVPVTGTAPAGSTLVVEIDVPDMEAVGRFFPGSNPDGQTAPTYLSSDVCGIPEPADAADLGAPEMHLVMNVTGSAGGDAPWLELDPTAATLAPGDSITVSAVMDSGATEEQQPGTYTATLAIAADTPYEVPDVEVAMEVTPPNRWGGITGTVTGTDCDGAETPIAGAIVQLNGKREQVTLLTGEDGTYTYWMPISNNAVTMIVATGTHVPQVRTVLIVPKRKVVEDFTLATICNTGGGGFFR